MKRPRCCSIAHTFVVTALLLIYTRSVFFDPIVEFFIRLYPNAYRSIRGSDIDTRTVMSLTRNITEALMWNANKSVISILDDQSSSHVQETFTTRLKQFNAALSAIRQRITSSAAVAARDDGNWLTSETSALKRLILVRGDSDDFMHRLDQLPEVTTVLLPWVVRRRQGPRQVTAASPSGGELLTSSSSKLSAAWTGHDDVWNLPVTQYYTWTGDRALCAFADTPDARINVPKDRNCSSNIDDAYDPTILDPLYLDWKPAQLLTHEVTAATATSPELPVGGSNSEMVQESSTGRSYVVTPASQLYVHVMDSVFVTSNNDVIGRRFKFVPNGCLPFFSLAVPRAALVDQPPIYDEAFVITQFWGYTVFHRMVEVVPRLAPFVDFLRSNPTIVVHGPEVGGRLAELVEIFGIDRSRLVAGLIRARTAYVPPVTHCGQPGVRQIQLTGEIYRKYIGENWSPLSDRVVLIQRTGIRRFAQSEAIERVIRAAADDFGLEFSLYGDNPSPSLNDTMRMFYSAVMVVAPHGAGESNIVFSRPGLFVIEGVCSNLCLKHTAHVMGHRWHGVRARSGCRTGVVDVTLSGIDQAVRRHLAMWRRLNPVKAAAATIR